MKKSFSGYHFKGVRGKFDIYQSDVDKSFLGVLRSKYYDYTINADSLKEICHKADNYEDDWIKTFREYIRKEMD